MANLSASGKIAAFSFHAYPGGSGNPPHTLPELLLNSTWLRNGILTGSSAQSCINWWREDGGGSPSAFGLVVTESSSSWNASLPQPAQDSFVNGFFSLAEWGQYSREGVTFLVRALGSFCCLVFIRGSAAGTMGFLRDIPVCNHLPQRVALGCGV